MTSARSPRPHVDAPSAAAHAAFEDHRLTESEVLIVLATRSSSTLSQMPFTRRFVVVVVGHKCAQHATDVRLQNLRGLKTTVLFSDDV